MNIQTRPPTTEPVLLRETEYHINPTGSFEIGGPDGDAGLTGRDWVEESCSNVSAIADLIYAKQSFGKVRDRPPERTGRVPANLSVRLTG